MANELIQDAASFEDTPSGWAKRWMVELQSARDVVKDWHKEASDVVHQFLDDNRPPNEGKHSTRINLFSANVQTQRALLYGKTPTVDVERRYGDPNDDDARLAAEMFERLLNCDIERTSDSYATSLEHALDDRLLAGFGGVKLRYEASFKLVPARPAIYKRNPDGSMTVGPDGQPVVLAPEVEEHEEKEDEDVDTDYFYWRDHLWSPCRVPADCRWRAYRTRMTREALHERFDGRKVQFPDPKNPKNVRVYTLTPREVDDIPLSVQEERGREKSTDANEKKRLGPWARAMVWEIWDKEHRRVWWVVEGYDKILDYIEDPLHLDDFWPSPMPLMANVTTTSWIPKPDFILAKDLYNEVHLVSTRITRLERAVKVMGVYDKNSVELKRLLSEAGENDMIPADNWTIFAEKGGMMGVVQWFPLDQIVGALEKLREYRTELIQLTYQITGFSDIMRGEGQANVTATEQAIKAKFASVRIQAFKDEFARFASEVQQIKAEIISKHYDPKTIISRSNSQYMMGDDSSVQRINKAVALMKSKFYEYRIIVKPESIALEDYAAMKEERSAVLTAVATYLQSSFPIIQAIPPAAVPLLQMLQWTVAGFRGSSTIEAVLDQAIVGMQQLLAQPKPPPPPDPKLEATKIKAEADIIKARLELAKSHIDAQAHAMRNRTDLHAHIAKSSADLEMSAAEHEMDMTKMGMEMKRDMMKMKKESEDD